MDLTDEQWKILEPLIPDPPRRADGKGRPWRDPRDVLDGILWVFLRTGCTLARPARALPALPDLPPPLSEMERGRGTRRGPSCASQRSEGARRARPLGVLRGRHIRGSQKGGASVGKTKRGKGTKLMALADGSGLPLAVYAASASPHEVTLVGETLAQVFTAERPQRLIGDKAYDSDPLDAELAEQGIELIAPHKSNRKKAATQDGRKLRRYKRRWKIERLFSWLQNFRRIAMRFDFHDENYLGFVHLGCIRILLRCYL